MNPLLISPLMELGSGIINRLFPDPEKKVAAELELLKMAQDKELQPILAQLAINAKQAEHPSIFVAGPRPFIMWICGIGLAYQTIFHNILEWVASIRGWPLPPAPDTDTLLYVLFALLGLGGYRTVEKIKKVTK